MKLYYVLLMTWGLSLNAMASPICKPKEGQDADKTAGSIEFNCGKGKKSFVAVCNIALDPVERGKRWLEIKQAKWKQHGDNQGIEGKFGFITCSKK